MKFMVTVPTPISTGGPELSFDAGMFDGVWGIQLFCPDGDLNGVEIFVTRQRRERQGPTIPS
jgi:hypothetical protein